MVTRAPADRVERAWAELALIANERVRTEHNCIARDIVQECNLSLDGGRLWRSLALELPEIEAVAF